MKHNETGHFCKEPYRQSFTNADIIKQDLMKHAIFVKSLEIAVHKYK